MRSLLSLLSRPRHDLALAALTLSAAVGCGTKYHGVEPGVAVPIAADVPIVHTVRMSDAPARPWNAAPPAADESARPAPAAAPAPDAEAAPTPDAEAAPTPNAEAAPAPDAEAEKGEAPRLPTIFSDNMVLQRGRPLPIWGWADPDAEVKIELRYVGPKRIALPPVLASVVADPNGKWTARLPEIKEPAGAMYVLAVQSGGHEITVKNVVAGDVWLASGQSNMQWALRSADGGEEAAAQADLPQLRFFRVNSRPALEPQDDVPDGRWVVCTPQAAPGFSAVAFYFARDLIERHRTPIGVIETSWGGMPAESYTSLEKLKKLTGAPDIERYVAKYDNARQAAETPSDEALAAWEAKAKANKESLDTVNRIRAAVPEAAMAYAAPAFDDAAWKAMRLPAAWERAKAGLDHFDGIVWFRRTVKIPAAWVGRDLRLALGVIDDDDITFANGAEVGRTQGWNTPRAYTIPAAANTAETLVLAVRCFDHGGEGGVYDGALTLAPKDAPEGEAPLDLAGDWEFFVEPGGEIAPAPGDMPGALSPNVSATLFNSRIAPTIPFAVRGAIWYQGESNTGEWDGRGWMRYRVLFPAMIEDWRARWGYDFPFYWAQLANFMGRSETPRDTHWAKLREAQTLTRRLPATGEAVLIDIGNPKDIHPRNKLDVGRRLALWARRDVHGEKIEPSGPTFKALKVDGAQATLTFEHVGGGLVAKGDAPAGAFALAGEDGKYTWAKAEITAPDTIVLTAEGVDKPVAVRYAWDDDPFANVYSADGLPMTPFRFPVPKTE